MAPEVTSQASEATLDTPSVNRRGGDRRSHLVDQRSARRTTGLERRRGPGRRRNDFVKSAEEGEMSREQFLFVMAINTYKTVNNTPYPTWTEILEVVRKLGYRKTCEMSLRLSNCEDWTEEPDAPDFPSDEAA